MNVGRQLYDYQLDAIKNMKKGCILCGGVGSGKSITSLGYYYLKNGGSVNSLTGGDYIKMIKPKDLYIITTARKRDTLEWEGELSKFLMSTTPSVSLYNNKVIVDSWNNIKKYKDAYNSFFIFDEQRVVGSGVWVKTFLNITRKNDWILLSATPGDQWKDYIPVFIANGFFKNKSDFYTQHCVFSRFSKFPKIDRYIGEKHLEKLRDSILIHMKDNRVTQREYTYINTFYDRDLYKKVFAERWDPYNDEPITECGKWYYLQRKVVNSSSDRIYKLHKIYLKHKRCIVFYNHNYELEIIKDFCEKEKIQYAEWNGQRHEQIPNSNSWLYLVQYVAGAEGWNCIETDTVVFYSLNYSYRTTEQAAGRIDRINTPYIFLHYYFFKSVSFIDKSIYNKLRYKKNFNENTKLFAKNDSRQKLTL